MPALFPTNMTQPTMVTSSTAGKKISPYVGEACQRTKHATKKPTATADKEIGHIFLLCLGTPSSIRSLSPAKVSYKIMSISKKESPPRPRLSTEEGECRVSRKAQSLTSKLTRVRPNLQQKGQFGLFLICGQECLPFHCAQPSDVTHTQWGPKDKRNVECVFWHPGCIQVGLLRPESAVLSTASIPSLSCHRTLPPPTISPVACPLALATFTANLPLFSQNALNVGDQITISA